jgi:arabinofuranan 3-O-arabinosyltransferase
MTDAPAGRRHRIGSLEVAALVAVTILPLFAGGRGKVNADTKQYLYLDPWDLLERSRTVWDSRVGGGAVTHQAIGYLWPMGPYYALMDALGAPDWVAQRLWVGGLQLAAALGALALFRHLLPRTWVHVPAAALYGLSPFVLGHITSQSGLLVPFAGLGWLVLCMAKALEAPRAWRWPAAFALVVTTCGSLNGSSVFFVVLAAVLWVPFAVRGPGPPGRRDGVRVLVRTGALTLVTQVWWLVAYAVGGGYNLPILEITETVRTTNATPSAPEVLRGLGYWFFYGGDTEGPWLAGLSSPYQTSGVLLVVSFAIPLMALAAGGALRWRHRAYFTTLVGLGTILAVGAYPISDPSPAGSLFERLSRSSQLVLSLRNTQRVAAIVVLGFAGLLAAALTTLSRRHVRAGAAAALALLVLVAGALPAQWRTGLVAERFHRDEELPDAWLQAAAQLDRGEGRVLELPGSDFATYRWGATLDPVSVGLTDRSVLARELVPLGGDAGADLLEALDRGLQEGWFEPAALAPVARLLGASEVLVRNDLAYERYRTVRPRASWPLLSSSGTGLEDLIAFGSPYENVAGPGRPMIDEIELGLEPSDDPLPQIAVFDVPGGGRSPLSTAPVGGGTIVDGDGEGVVSAAAAGLLDAPGALLLGADVVRGDDLAAVTDGTTRVVLTDTNRKRAKRWYSLRENAGATEPVDQSVVLDDPSDARLQVAGTTPAGTQTVVQWPGVERIWATAYGSQNTLVPEERPSNAFDGDRTTAWRSERGADGTTRRIGVELAEPADADHLTLVGPQDRLGTVTLTDVRVTLDGDRRFDVRFDPDEAHRPEGLEVALDGQPFREVEVEILGTDPTDGLAGFAEIAIPGVTVEELVARRGAERRAAVDRADPAPGEPGRAAASGPGALGDPRRRPPGAARGRDHRDGPARHHRPRLGPRRPVGCRRRHVGRPRRQHRPPGR